MSEAPWSNPVLRVSPFSQNNPFGCHHRRQQDQAEDVGGPETCGVGHDPTEKRPQNHPAAQDGLVKTGPLPFSFQEADRIVQTGVVGQAGAKPKHDKGRGEDKPPAGGVKQQQPGSGQELPPEEVEFVEVPAFAPPEKKETEELGKPDAAHQQANRVRTHRQLSGEFRKLVPRVSQNEEGSKVGDPDGVKEIPPELRLCRL